MYVRYDCLTKTNARDVQRFARNVSKPITIAFDEYGVWDETVGKRI